MAFESSVKSRTVFGNKRIVIGNYNHSGGTGGTISTGLNVVDAMFFSPTEATIQTSPPTINVTTTSALSSYFPHSGGDIAIIIDSSQHGIWVAIGY